MIDFAYTGLGLLMVGTLTALLTCVVAFQFPKEPVLLKNLVSGQGLFFGFSFLSLILCFIHSDFSVMVVTLHSAVTTPLIYKISAAWSHHEGSLLLWVFFMALFSCFLAHQNIPEPAKRWSVGVQSLLILLFGLFICVTSNPFQRLFPIPLDGHDLNPLLQDASVVFHPPLLYAGLQGFSVLFSLTIAILLNHKRKWEPTQWGQWMRPWVFLSTAALTGGICLGSFWAYYELGWGGWWFWDPVENISLIPWLAAIGLLHSLMVLVRRGGSGRWVLCQGLSIYALILLGLVMVRSGALTSVHGFAQDHERGLILLFMVTAVIVSGFSLFLLSFRSMGSFNRSASYPQLQSAGLKMQSVLLSLGAGVLFLGTVYPLLMDLWAQVAVHVGLPFYKRTVVPLMLPVCLLLGVLPFLEEQGDQKALRYRVLPLTLMAGVVLLWGFWQVQTPSWDQAVCYGGAVVGAWLVLLTLVDGLSKWRAGGKRLQVLGMFLSHLGLSLFILSASVERGLSQEWTGVMSVGQSLKVPLIDSGELCLEKMDRREGPNYVAERATLHLFIGDLSTGGISYAFTPEKRQYVPAGQLVSESSQRFTWWHTYYMTVGEAYTNGAITVTLAVHPLVIWIWISALIMVLGLALGFSGHLMAAFRLGRGMASRK